MGKGLCLKMVGRHLISPSGQIDVYILSFSALEGSHISEFPDVESFTSTGTRILKS